MYLQKNVLYLQKKYFYNYFTYYDYNIAIKCVKT